MRLRRRPSADFTPHRSEALHPTPLGSTSPHTVRKHFTPHRSEAHRPNSRKHFTPHRSEALHPTPLGSTSPHTVRKHFTPHRSEAHRPNSRKHFTPHRSEALHPTPLGSTSPHTARKHFTPHRSEALHPTPLGSTSLHTARKHFTPHRSEALRKVSEALHPRVYQQHVAPHPSKARRPTSRKHFTSPLPHASEALRPIMPGKCVRGAGPALADAVPVAVVGTDKPDEGWQRWTRLNRSGDIDVEAWQRLHRMCFSEAGVHFEGLPPLLDGEGCWTHPWWTASLVWPLSFYQLQKNQGLLDMTDLPQQRSLWGEHQGSLPAHLGRKVWQAAPSWLITLGFVHLIKFTNCLKLTVLQAYLRCQ